MSAHSRSSEVGEHTSVVFAEPMISPATLLDLVPRTDVAAVAVRAARSAIREVLDGSDDRLLVVVGPCSIHDRDAALEYAARLADAAERHADDLLVVMRAYIEKPRTVLGWVGLAMAPTLDGPADPVRGFQAARSIMAEIVEMGLPVGTEWLNPLSPDYLADLVAWGCVGARSVECQHLRQMASALDMPVGMKNRTDGCVRTAVNAVHVAGQPHTVLGLDPAGTVSVRRSAGNPDCHVVLRGGESGPNHRPAQIRAARRLLRSAGLPERVLVDASHGNSGKDHERQRAVARDLARQVEGGDEAIRGILLESFLLPGRQEPAAERHLTYGQSVTDSCLGWAQTDLLLTELGRAAQIRRGKRFRGSAGCGGQPRTDTVSVEGSPAARAVTLVETGLFDTYVLYEREGVWTVAGGVRGSVTLDASRIRTTWRGEERSHPWRVRPLAAIGAALASLPTAEWNAYGWITFETALLASQRAVPAQDCDLAHLIVPENEVRISAGSASITCADDNLRRAVHKALLQEVPDDDNCPSVAVDLSEGGQRYRDAVAEAIREIRRGAFRKVILSRKVPLPAPVDLARTYLRGRAANTPARSFLVSAGGMTAAGFCPETILEADADGFVSTQPLAGTRAFGTQTAQNRRLRAELLSDAKELVEHILSVQLAFEELEGVCSPGSVAVSELLSVRERGSVQHLASRVSGRLKRGLSAWEALEAVFPAVTASGIPKAPSCDFIARSEPGRRGLYSGVVLTASSDGSLDAGLILRALFEEGGRQWLRAGAGIIAESRPDREYEETCEKLRSVAPYLVPRALQGAPPAIRSLSRRM